MAATVALYRTRRTRARPPPILRCPWKWPLSRLKGAPPTSAARARWDNWPSPVGPVPPSAKSHGGPCTPACRVRSCDDGCVPERSDARPAACAPTRAHRAWLSATGRGRTAGRIGEPDQEDRIDRIRLGLIAPCAPKVPHGRGLTRATAGPAAAMQVMLKVSGHRRNVPSSYLHTRRLSTWLATAQGEPKMWAGAGSRSGLGVARQCPNVSIGCHLRPFHLSRWCRGLYLYGPTLFHPTTHCQRNSL